MKSLFKSDETQEIAETTNAIVNKIDRMLLTHPINKDINRYLSTNEGQELMEKYLKQHVKVYNVINHRLGKK